MVDLQCQKHHFRANSQVAPKTWAIKLVVPYLWLWLIMETANRYNF